MCIFFEIHVCILCPCGKCLREFMEILDALAGKLINVVLFSFIFSFLFFFNPFLH